MVQRSWGQVKQSIADISGTSGMPVTDTRVLSQMNLAQEELINEGEFPGVVDRWKIVSNGSGRIALPSHLDRLLQITIAGQAQEIKSPWFSFVGWGPGIQDDARFFECETYDYRSWCDGGNILDVGELPTTQPLPDALDTSLPGPWSLRVYADPTTNETPGATLLAQGTGSDGLQIRTQISDGSGTYIDGEEIAISSGSGFAQSTSLYETITAIEKPVTKGYVRLAAWNGVTEIDLSTYTPQDTCPSYHHYFSPWLRTLQSTSPCCRTIIARCRRRFVPVAQDGDKLIITNLPALRQMIRAIWKRDAGEIDEYVALKTTAVDLLNKEAMAYRGKARTPTFVFGRGFAIGALPSIR